MNSRNFITTIKFIFFLLFSINSKFLLDIENLNYIECFDLLDDNETIQNKIEKQNIHRLINPEFYSDKSNQTKYFNFIFNNTRLEETSNSRTNNIKNQNFLKYKNFTLEKNFQIFLKIKKNPEFINNENTEKFSLQKMQKKGLFIWILRNNKFSFENIRKNIEFNGLALKISEAEIKFIISNKEKNIVIKPFFDANNDYKNVMKEKIITTNLREEILKFTAVKNMIFVEKFNNLNNRWEILFFDNLSFFTYDNFGINLEIISEINDQTEQYTLEFLKTCSIKNINYNINKNYNNKRLQEENKLNINNTEIHYEKKRENEAIGDNFKKNFENLGLLNYLSNEEEKNQFIFDINSIFEVTNKLLSKLKLISNPNTETNTENTLNERLIANNTIFDIMYNSLMKFYIKYNESIKFNENIIYSKDNYPINNNNNKEINNDYYLNFYKNLEKLIEEIKIDKDFDYEKNRENDKIITDNFYLMINNLNRLERNLKLIISESESEIKLILNDLLDNHNILLNDLIEYLIFFMLLTMIILLYYIYRYVNLLIEIPKDYVKLSREINTIEKNNMS